MNNCSICGWGVAWCVDKEDKGTYWLCGRCAVEDVREKIPQQRTLVSVARMAEMLFSNSAPRDTWKQLEEALGELPEGLI